MDPRERHLSTLGLGPDASLEDIKRAYRELTKRWHPDRFAGEPALQAEATEELRRIVEAYRALTRPPAAEAPGPAVIVPSPAREPAPRARRHTRDAAASARTTASPPRRDAGAPARTPSPRRLLAARLTARAGILFPLALGLLILLRWPRPAGLGVLSGLLALGGLALGAWLLADRGGVRRLLGVGPVDGAATAALALVLFAGLAVLGRVAPYAFVAAEEAYPVYTWEGVGGGAPDAEPDAAPPAATRPEPPRRPTAAMRPRPADPAASAGRVADGDGVAAGRMASAGRVALAERVPSAAREAAPGRPPAAARPPASAASPRPADLAAAGPRAPARPEPAWREPARAEAARPAPVQPEPARPEPARLDPARAEPARAELAVAEPARTEPAAAQPARAEPARPAAPVVAAPARAVAAPVAERAAPAVPAPARVAEPGVAATAEAPTRGPILLNARDVGIALDAAYPAALRAAGIGGIVVVRALVDTDGAVGKVEVRRSSGHPELDEAARSVARAMWFSPALRGGQPTRVWIQFPVAFQPR